MSWTTPGDVKAQLSRLWERGDLLRPLVTGERPIPMRLALKGPSSDEVTERFEAVRAWTAELSAVPHVRIEWREVRHRVQGMQRLPQSVWIDALDGALALLGKRRDAERFSRLVEVARAALPSSMPWLARRPLQAIELADQWPRLVAVVGWLVEHPRPGIYLRQVDIPGIHSKFIEAHRAVLSELLDLALAPEAITAEKAGCGAVRRPLWVPGQAGAHPLSGAGRVHPAVARGGAPRCHVGCTQLRLPGALPVGAYSSPKTKSTSSPFHRWPRPS